jgi:N-acetylglutamate synthase-like GNAT family acetyltransferase
MTPELATAADIPEIRRLILSAFAYMEARIDPPSSILATTEAELAAAGEFWLIREEGAIVACVMLKPSPPHLYLGRLAVAESHRGKGLARQLVAKAESRARALGLSGIELGVRVELTENHAAFTALGFRKVREESHPGYDRVTSYRFVKEVA